MRYLLDTTVLSEARRQLAHPGVVAWLDAVAEEDLAISVLTLGEIGSGVERLDDPSQQRHLRWWLEHDLRARFGKRVLSVDAEVATGWGRIAGEAARRGRSVSAIAGLLIATAAHHHLALVTHNVADVEGYGVAIVDPWDV
jgi:toxin FitB